MGKYLDNDGLSYFWGKIKAYVQQQIQAIGAITGVKGDAESTYRTGNVNLTPANLGITDFTGSTSSAAGSNGLVPAPDASVVKKVLCSDGDWSSMGASVAANPTNDTLTVSLSDLTSFTLWPATQSQPGLMSTENVAALNGKADAADLGDLAYLDEIPNHSTSKLTSGILALARGGTATNNTARAINTVFAGPSSGSAGNASWRKLVAADIPNHSTSKLTSGTLGIARGGTGSSSVVSIANTSTLTIFVWGKLVMVQLHGVTKAPGTSVAISSTAYLADYKPSYNASALVSGPENDNKIARLWVSKDDGKVYLNAVNTTASTAWYGTLVYMLA